MVRFTASTTALLLAAGTVVNASPVGQNRPSSEGSSQDNVTMRYDVGYDDSLVRTLRTTDVIPEIVYLDSEQYRTLESDNATSLEPFIPEDEQNEINGNIKRFISGKDDREQFTSKAYPWRNVGRIGWSNGVVCSAALVGPRHILTAKHCALVEGATARFAPGYDRGEPFGSGQVIQIALNSVPGGSACGTKNDWAVMVLDNRLGDKLGWFGVKTADPEVRKDWPGFWSMGYPGDLGGTLRPYRVAGNPILSSKPWDCDGLGPVYTATDVSGGQSGGPLWGRTGDKRYIWGTLSVGIQSGGDAWAGWAAGANMVSAIQRVRADFP